VINPRDEVKVCDICSQSYKGYGHNAAPVKEGRCCDTCHWHVVLPARFNLGNIAKDNLECS
jgi:hypothetical protein